MEKFIFKFIVSLLIFAITSVLTTWAYKIWTPSERADKIAKVVIRIFVFIVIVITAICAIYIILSDLGYVDPITPLFPKK